MEIVDNLILAAGDVLLLIILAAKDPRSRHRHNAIISDPPLRAVGWNLLFLLAAIVALVIASCVTSTIMLLLGSGNYLHGIIYFGLSIVPAGVCYTLAVIFHAVDSAKNPEPAKGMLHRIGGVLRLLSLLLAIAGPFLSRRVADHIAGV